MRPALLLIDFQRDYLDRPGLQPAENALAACAERLLQACRRVSVPVFHVQTLVRADGSNRMPHWLRDDRWACVEGTHGALPPPMLAPSAGEEVFAKPFFSAFDNPELEAVLAADGVDTLVVAGLYTHACIRASVLDAYRRGYHVWIAADAVGSDNALHARLTLEYLDGRAARCLDVAEIVRCLDASADAARAAASGPSRVWLHRNPACWDEVLAEVPVCGAREVAAAAGRAQRHAGAWAGTPASQRADRLGHWLACLAQRREQLLALLANDVGKPRIDATAEYDYAIALLRHAITLADSSCEKERSANFRTRYCPHGVVGLITPFNNPLAIPVGKLAPALACGNTVVWKPALQCQRPSLLLMESLAEAGLQDMVNMVTGDAATAQLLLAQQEIRAVSFTGSITAGRRVAAVCASRGMTLQAEMGGNNAVLVMADADVESVARQLAPAIFSFAGQRCTAPRRLIVEQPVRERFEAALVEATAELKLGLPQQEDVCIGPLISRDQQNRIAALAAAGLAAGGRLLCGGFVPQEFAGGCWFAPTLIADSDAASMLVQQESFGPLAVVLAARDFEHALALANATPYGLAATLFSGDAGMQRRFMDGMQAGILVLNRVPAIDPAAPFAGWKASGAGLPEHGRWDMDFYTRPQAVYGA